MAITFQAEHSQSILMARERYYCECVRLQREVRHEQVVHKLATNEIRPPALAAVNY